MAIRRDNNIPFFEIIAKKIALPKNLDNASVYK